jgi:hypothetical protein
MEWNYRRVMSRTGCIERATIAHCISRERTYNSGGMSVRIENGLCKISVTSDSVDGDSSADDPGPRGDCSAR